MDEKKYVYVVCDIDLSNTTKATDELTDQYGRNGFKLVSMYPETIIDSKGNPYKFYKAVFIKEADEFDFND